MVLANFDRIRSTEIIRFVVDFLTMLDPTSPGIYDPPLGTVFVSRGCWLRGLT